MDESDEKRGAQNPALFSLSDRELFRTFGTLDALQARVTAQTLDSANLEFRP